MILFLLACGQELGPGTSDVSEIVLPEEASGFLLSTPWGPFSIGYGDGFLLWLALLTIAAAVGKMGRKSVNNFTTKDPG